MEGPWPARRVDAAEALTAKYAADWPAWGHREIDYATKYCLAATLTPISRGVAEPDGDESDERLSCVRQPVERHRGGASVRGVADESVRQPGRRPDIPRTSRPHDVLMRLARPVATGAAAVLVLLTAGCGVAAALSADPPAGGGADASGTHVRGTVTAENGPSWTVTTAKNRTVTVTLTPQTAFGTRKAPASAAQFTVGAPVRVTGAKQGDTVTAERVTAPAPAASAAPRPSA